MKIFRLLIKKSKLIARITTAFNYQHILKRINKIDTKIQSLYEYIDKAEESNSLIDLTLIDYEYTEYYKRINASLDGIKSDRIDKRKNFDKYFTL